jgi:2-C-methyl-D-erythritol 4-phosphate cytidylyltransferase
VAAIVVAAGRSERLGRDKLFVELAGRPLLEWTLSAFEACELVDIVALVLSESNLSLGTSLARSGAFPKVGPIRLGGARRQDSVCAGLDAVGGYAWVAVHDGARPLLTPDLIERGIVAARETGAAIPGVQPKDTVKRVGAGCEVIETPDRSRLRAIQTPQVFRRDLLVAAYSNGCREVTDDAALLEAIGLRVVVYPGSYENLKVTTPDDVVVAEALLSRRLAAR